MRTEALFHYVVTVYWVPLRIFKKIYCMGRPLALLFHSNLKMSIPHYQIDSMVFTAHIKNLINKNLSNLINTLTCTVFIACTKIRVQYEWQEVSLHSSRVALFHFQLSAAQCCSPGFHKGAAHSSDRSKDWPLLLSPSGWVWPWWIAWLWAINHLN